MYVEEGSMDIQVQRMYRFESDRPLKAFADIIVNDALLIKGIKVLRGNNGLFVSMPQEQAKDKKWYDSVRCLTQEVREQITSTVLAVYNEEGINNMADGNFTMTPGVDSNPVCDVDEPDNLWLG